MLCDEDTTFDCAPSNSCVAIFPAASILSLLSPSRSNSCCVSDNASMRFSSSRPRNIELPPSPLFCLANDIGIRSSIFSASAANARCVSLSGSIILLASLSPLSPPSPNNIPIVLSILSPSLANLFCSSARGFIPLSSSLSSLSLDLEIFNFVMSFSKPLAFDFFF